MIAQQHRFVLPQSFCDRGTQVLASHQIDGAGEVGQAIGKGNSRLADGLKGLARGRQGHCVGRVGVNHAVDIGPGFVEF